MYKDQIYENNIIMGAKNVPTIKKIYRHYKIVVLK